MEPVAVIRSQLSVRGQFQDGYEEISVHCQSMLPFTPNPHILSTMAFFCTGCVPFVLHHYVAAYALYDRSCTAPLNPLLCYGALEIIVTHYYPRRSRSAIGVDIVFTLDVCMFVCLYVC